MKEDDMTVAEFVKFDKGGALYRIVNAAEPGYMSTCKAMIEADKNVMKASYGEWQVVGFELLNRRVMMLYAKEVK